MRSSLIHKFKLSCVRCKSEYVGIITRTHGVRVDEHAGISFRTGARITTACMYSSSTHRGT